MFLFFSFCRLLSLPSPSTKMFHLGPPKKRFMFLISWERTQKRDAPLNFVGGIEGSKRGSQTCHFGHEEFSFCLFPVLVFEQGMRTATFQFSESSSSLHGLDLFTELPFLWRSLRSPSFTECLLSSHWKIIFDERCFVASAPSSSYRQTPLFSRLVCCW